MYAIYLKELRSYLSSLIAYIVIGVFLLAIGLFMWVFPDTNVLDAGYANIDTLFFIGPWIFIFLVSAITMRTFSEEKKQGTIEILATSPTSDITIILAKFFAGVSLLLISLIPTLIYYYSIHKLGDPVGNIDTGSMWGSYVGLILIGSAFVSIGLFSSVITDNQVVAFVLSTFLCFVFYTAFQYLGEIGSIKNIGYYIQWTGLYFHYESISRGVLDTRDVIYFLSFITLFLALTKTIYGSRKW